MYISGEEVYGFPFHQNLKRKKKKESQKDHVAPPVEVSKQLFIS